MPDPISLLNPFGRSALPVDFDREARIRLIDQAAKALLDGREVPRHAALFLGSALMAWLQNDGTIGSLERKHLRVTQTRRSRLTPARLWQRLQQDDAERCRPTTTADPDTDTLPVIATENIDVQHLQGPGPGTSLQGASDREG